MTVNRFDKSSFKRATRLDNGWLRAPAHLTRTGVFLYRDASGKIRRELRLPEDVFSKETVASFDLVPLTDDHPYAHKGVVTSANAKKLSVGTVGNLRQDGSYLAAEVNVTDAEAVAKVLSGKAQLSCGYKCDLEPAAPGAEYEGQRYDFIQRNIRGNHVAIVDVGRAGPEARIHLDAETHIDEELQVEIKTDTEQVAEVETPPAAVPEVNYKTELEKAVARADAADREIARLNAELTKANDPARLQALVASRVALESQVREVAPGVKCDGLSDIEVMKATITHLDSELSLEGKSAEAVQAYFDSTLRYSKKRNVVTEAAAVAIAKSQKLDANEQSPAEVFYNKIYGVKR